MDNYCAKEKFEIFGDRLLHWVSSHSFFFMLLETSSSVYFYTEYHGMQQVRFILVMIQRWGELAGLWIYTYSNSEVIGFHNTQKIQVLFLKILIYSRSPQISTSKHVYRLTSHYRKQIYLTDIEGIALISSSSD